MKRHIPALAALLAGPLAACNDPNTAVFVTTSSVGINVDTKPATVSVAYDRLEGFIGPRYDNGGAPPVVASMEIQGDTLNPTIRQTYATGAAAVGATTGKVPDDAAKTMEGASDKKKLMFFGTATTFGVKIGFATAGAPVPDSFVLGYRRKEASIIPIAEEPVDGKPGVVKGVYPSVLGSMEVNVKSTDQSAGTAPNAGLVTKQFFATGQAANELSTNGVVRQAFRQKAEDAALAGLTDEQKAAARARGMADRTTASERLDKVIAHITTNGALDKDKLAVLVTEANKGKTEPVVPENLKQAASVDVVRRRIRNAQFAIDALYAAIPAN